MTGAELRLLLAPAAERDLEAAWRWGAEAWSPDRADRYLDALAETFEVLRAMPGIARERPEVTPPVRAHPSGRHVIVYRVEGDALVVLRVLGGRTDWRGVLGLLD